MSRVDDRELVERQIGRRPRAFRRVVARCPFGLPAVTEQEPYDDAGAPFPTTYYLTCRHLIAAVSRLEAGGGVERWSAAVAASPDLTADLAGATADQRRIRHALAAGRTGLDHGTSLDSGIGGSRNPAQLKCLHAHVAFALAEPGLPRRAAHPCRDPRAMAGGALLCRDGADAVTVDLDGARRDWEDGYRRFELASRDDGVQAERLRQQFDIISAELRRRVGGTFTLVALGHAYAGSDGWARLAIEEYAPTPGWARTVTLVGDAAFHVYSRGAVDYMP